MANTALDSGAGGVRLAAEARRFEYQLLQFFIFHVFSTGLLTKFKSDGLISISLLSESTFNNSLK